MIEESVFFNSNGRQIKGCLSYPDTGNSVLPILICPPHPLLGGDEDNNVIRVLNAKLVQERYSVLRFNYGGVGESETHLDLKIQEEQFWVNQSCPEYESQMIEDAFSAFKFLGDQFDNLSVRAIVGYSFGCLPALQIFRASPKIQRLILISPPLTKWRLDPSHFLQGRFTHFFYTDGDFACPKELILDLVSKIPEPKSLSHLPGEGHFYIGSESELSDTVIKTLFMTSCCE